MKRNKPLARALPFAATALLLVVCLTLPLLFLNGEGEPGPATERALTLGRRAEIYALFAADEGLNMERLDEAGVGNDEYISCINTANAIIDTLVMDEGETRLENPFGTNFYTLTEGGDSIRIMEYYYEWTGDWHNWFTMHIDLDTGLVYYLYYSANVQQNGGLYIGRAEEHPFLLGLGEEGGAVGVLVLLPEALDQLGGLLGGAALHPQQHQGAGEHAAGGPHLHSGPEVGPQGVRLLLGETHLRSEGDQQGLGAVVVAAVRLGAQILYFFQTGHGKFLLMVYRHQLKISGGTGPYRLPRRISRATNFMQSSTIQRQGRSARPLAAAFSRAQATMPLEASTCVTEAPAARQASVAPPV